MIDVKQRGAWFGDPEFKAQIMEKMLDHRAKDRFYQTAYREFVGEGETLENFRGCAIGCLLTSKLGLQVGYDANWRGWHWGVEDEFNIPRMIARRIDSHFEECSFDEAAEFAVDSIDAIAVGANLNELVAQIEHASWHADEAVTQFEIDKCKDCKLSWELRDNRELFLKELSNAPLMPAARAVILAG